MDEIFAKAKNILVVWDEQVNSDILFKFEKTLQIKSKQAKILLENIQKLFESHHTTSSFDLILFNIVNENDSLTNTEYLNEFFRLLHPNGYLINHIQHLKQNQAIDHFKMCGFTTCNPLNSNASLFLLENKNDQVKQLGSLWLCQKPSFDVGYSVPLRRSGANLIRQISTTSGKKIWTVENEDEDDDDDDDMIDNNQIFNDNDRKKFEMKINNISSNIRDTNKERSVRQENNKTSSENYSLIDTFQSGFTSSKSNDNISLPHMSEV